MDAFSHLVDRVGAPLALVVLFAWVASLAIRGPGMELAKLVGASVAQLCKAGVDYLQEATRRLEVLPAHVSLEAARVREQVAHEGAATRAHVSDAVERLRDRVSSAENEIGAQVQRAATGSHPAINEAPPGSSSR